MDVRSLLSRTPRAPRTIRAPDARPATRAPRRLACGLASIALLLAARSAWASEQDAPPDPLQGSLGASARAADGVDGPAITYATRPTSAPDLRACSSRIPVCVHASSSRDGPAALAALDAFERAWQALTGALAIPPPDVDPTTLAYDVFLVDPLGGPRLATTLLEARDLRSRVDRARAFTLVDRRVRSGCLLDALAASALARASLYRLAPSTEEGTAEAQAAYLAQLVSPCSAGLAADAAHAFQARPERALCDARAGETSAAPGLPPISSPTSDLFAAGAAAFWARLDWAFGRIPGGVVVASWALGPTMTPPGAARWVNEPDTFDVLRATFKGALSTGGTVNDLWLDFGVARAFLGSSDDGFHLPESRTLGDLARVPVDWDVAWPSAPRRLGPRAPVWPTGASYVVVRGAGARPGARLRAEIEWEEHSLFRWAFVKLDASGREIGRVVVPTTERATSAQMTLVELDGVDRVVLVGVNVGDPAYAFDPDDEVWEPHGWLVTLAEEPSPP